MTDHARASGKKVVLLAATAGALVLGGLFAAFGVFGRGRFERGSHMAEAHSNVAVLARGIAECAGARNALPPAAPVVARGFDADVFRCARFSPTDTQRFSYGWTPETETTGTALAEGDLDGDGAPDTGFRVTLRCTRDATTLRCAVGPVDPVAIAPRR